MLLYVTVEVRAPEPEFKGRDLNGVYLVLPNITKLRTPKTKAEVDAGIFEKNGWKTSSSRSLEKKEAKEIHNFQQVVNFHQRSRRKCSSDKNSRLLLARVVGVHSYHQSLQKGITPDEQFNNLFLKKHINNIDAHIFTSNDTSIHIQLY